MVGTHAQSALVAVAAPDERMGGPVLGPLNGRGFQTATVNDASFDDGASRARV